MKYCPYSFKSCGQLLLENALLDLILTAGYLPKTKLGGKEFKTL